MSGVASPALVGWGRLMSTYHMAAHITLLSIVLQSFSSMCNTPGLVFVDCLRSI